ncbi:MAG: integration host factor subunit alpha [Rickettsiales bacterium]|jgi:integration host factor subunit alpha|nr:integration host factor subunit alpha [Rickettsiales bacterium]
MSNTLTRAALTDAIYKEIGLSLAESASLVDDVLETVIIALEAGEDVKISSFGSFRRRQKNARIGRNPKTKQEAVITPRTVVTFHASNLLKQYLNDNK